MMVGTAARNHFNSVSAIILARHLGKFHSREEIEKNGFREFSIRFSSEMELKRRLFEDRLFVFEYLL